MADPGQTPLDFTFSRENFLRGGPDGVDSICKLFVYNHTGKNLLYRFDQMMVYQTSELDAEKINFLQSSNDKVKQYVFDRAVKMIAVQAMLIDAVAKQDDSLAGAITQQAYQEFLWLYENELKISAGVMKRRVIAFEIHQLRHFGYVDSLTDGWAAEAEWQVPCSFEFVVLRSERIALPNPRRRPITAGVSRQLLREQDPVFAALGITPADAEENIFLFE